MVNYAHNCAEIMVIILSMHISHLHVCNTILQHTLNNTEMNVCMKSSQVVCDTVLVIVILEH